MKLKNCISNSWFFIAFIHVSFAQVSTTNNSSFVNPIRENSWRVMFYNVENLFDTFDDPVIDDDEFTPNGDKNWTYYRYKEKLNNIAKTIIAVGGWEPPTIIGLCEVENFQVLMDLTNETPLKKFGYQIIHENSQDSRGIDNAILYLPDKLKKIEHQSIHVDTEERFKTRDILYASFSINEMDTIHFFVNHWPSRFGGKEFTEEKRLLVAKSLRTKVDSLQLIHFSPKIVVMGDFNDEPEDASLVTVLNARPADHKILFNQLYNLSSTDYRNGKGTLVYKEIDHTWFLFDQIIVSGALVKGTRLQTLGMKSHIFSSEWLLENGRPKRSFQGPIYRGGISDHLPIFIDLYYYE